MPDEQPDACLNYSGVQDVAEIAAKGFVDDGQGHCRLTRNHEALALSGVDLTLMEGWTGAGIPIAVIDSGFRVTHEAIAQQILSVAAYRDSDNDYVLEEGEKTIGDSAPLVAAHGTSVASLVTGQGMGVAPGAGLWLKAMADENPRTVDLAIATVDALNNEGLGIINHSNDLFSSGLIYLNAGNDYTGILPALTASRSVTIAAAGNSGEDLSNSLDAANAAESTLQSFFEVSNEASHVILVGVYDAASADIDVGSNYPGHRQHVQARFLVTGGTTSETASSGSDSAYRNVEGTSFAAPLVSGAIAVLLEANPRLTPVEAADILLETARRPAELGYGKTCTSTTHLGEFFSDCGAMTFGMGIMDLPAAMMRARSGDGV